MKNKLLFVLLTLPMMVMAGKKPDWLKNHPTSDSHYVGVAKVSKEQYPKDYEQKALELALSYLSSEIKVSVASTTEDVSKDINGQIDLQFESQTVTVSKEDVEGYKIEDKWENRKEYAVYCRLSKATYIQNKRNKFIGTFKMMRDRLAKIQASIQNRDFNRAVTDAAQLKKQVPNFLKNKDILPYMSKVEIGDLSKFSEAYDQIIDKAHIIVSDKNVLPFAWNSGDNIKISLVDDKDNPWKNWSGKLIKNKEEIHQFEEQEDYTLDFPTSIFLYNIASTQYQLSLNTPKGKLIKQSTFSIPVSTTASKGKISAKNISSKLKTDVNETIDLFFSDSQQSGNKPKSTVNVKIRFVPTYTSDGWVKGRITMIFSNQGIKNGIARGTGKLEIYCKGNSQNEATEDGLRTLRNLIEKSQLSWK